jgi:hypothetical protein
MAGGIRYVVCCDYCGIDATDVESFVTEAAAMHARDWVSHEGGWLWRKPNHFGEELLCPECAAGDVQ